jgi:NTE family protein
MNNIPADVARSMGADKVIAVNVGDLTDLAEDKINYSMLGLGGETLDAMMRANSLKALASADVVIDVPLAAYGSLDWRRYKALIAEGYKAAEAMRDRLLPLAVDDAAWQAWVSARAARRKTMLPTPTALVVEGAGTSDTKLTRQVLEAHVGHPLDLPKLDADLTMLAGLDRYQTLAWLVVPDVDGDRLEVRATAKRYGPPFVYFGMSLENTTADDVSFNMSSRYLAYDLVGSGSELRFDVAVGSQPSVASALYRPLGSTPLFVEPFAGIDKRTLNYIKDDHIVASYGETRSGVGFDLGVNVGRLDDVRLRTSVSRLDAGVQIGDPGLPDLRGAETVFSLRWTHDGQDSPVVPSRGIRSRAFVSYFASAPELPAGLPEHTRNRGSHAGRVDRVVLLVLWRPRQESRLPVRRGWHIVRRTSVGARAVRARWAVPARRLQHRRTAWRRLSARDRRLSPTGDAPAGFSWRRHLPRRMAGQRRGLRRVA